jgi:mannose-1-phosphate guanylyltransferase
MLLAAGHGTRLRPLTERMPKAMVPVGGMPAIEHNLRLVRRHGVGDVIINLHAHPDAIPAYVGDGGRWGLHVTYSREERLLGTAGAVKRMEQALAGETFAVVYADNLSDSDLRALLGLHRRTAAVATLALHEVQDPRASGIVDVDEEGRVRGFVEKPQHAVPGAWANAGVYILEPSILRAIPPGVPYDFGHDLFPRLLTRGCPLYAAHVCSYFLAIDTPERYAAAQAFFAQRHTC